MEKSEMDYNLLDWWKKIVLKNYANFSGRARRAEFWNFVLVNLIVYVLLGVGLVFLESEEFPLISGVFGILLPLFVLAMLLPGLAVFVRRLHDINKNGNYVFFYFVPLVGFLFLLTWACTPGDPFRNRFGDDPKNPGIPELEFTGQ